MRLRTIAASFAVAVAAALPLAGTASAAPDRDCPDFATQAEAQAAFDSRAGDPERLDADGDGYACESRFGKPDGGSAPVAAAGRADEDVTDAQVREVPQGAVDTGDGSATTSPAPALLVLGGVAALGVAARRTARRTG